MRINNGYETITATPADFSTASTSKTKIVLTYTGALWGELLLEIQNATYSLFDSADDTKELILYNQVVKAEEIAVSFNVQRQTIRAAAVVDITATNGRTTQAKIKLDLSDAELTAVLNAFFSGYTGLNPEYERHCRAFYKAWKQSAASRAA